MDVSHFEDHGNGLYLAKFKDGTEYGVDLNSADTAQMHTELANMIRAGGVTVRPRERSRDDVIAYLERCIDSIATARMKIPYSGVDAVQKAKLDEARDVLDVVLSEGEAAISALSPDDRLLRYPLLSASGLDVVATAKLVQARALEQRQELSKVETWRLEAKRQVRLAPTADLAELAYKAMTQ